MSARELRKELDQEQWDKIDLTEWVKEKGWDAPLPFILTRFRRKFKDSLEYPPDDYVPPS